MNISISRLITGWFILAVLLTGIVPVYDFMLSTFQSEIAAVPGYSNKEMLFAIIGETLRALLLIYLYPQLKNTGNSFFHALWFGLITTSLVGSVWLFIGYGSFNLTNPNSFLINDTIILLLQGIISGIVLYGVYKNKKVRLIT
jgi:heme/copper-type cytochrome/quinol oxidase subunit 4